MKSSVAPNRWRKGETANAMLMREHDPEQRDDRWKKLVELDETWMKAMELDTPYAHLVEDQFAAVGVPETPRQPTMGGLRYISYPSDANIIGLSDVDSDLSSYWYGVHRSNLDRTLISACIKTAPSPTEIAERLADAMKELDGVRAEAAEEGYPVPSVELVGRVKKLLDRLVTAHPHWYSVYPMESGEIAIHASNEPTGAVVVTCRPYDTWCVVSIGKSRRRAWFESMDELPDPFTHKALRDLAG